MKKELMLMAGMMGGLGIAMHSDVHTEVAYGVDDTPMPGDPDYEGITAVSMDDIDRMERRAKRERNKPQVMAPLPELKIERKEKSSSLKKMLGRKGRA